jgi:hypothetical protein
MPGPFIFTGTYAIRDGKLDAAKKALEELTTHVDANEPRLHHFGFYLDEDGRTVTCVQVHPDSASMELHMKVIADHLQDAGDYLDFGDMQTRVFGVPSPELLRELRDMDGDALRVASPLFGFERLPQA